MENASNFMSSAFKKLLISLDCERVVFFLKSLITVILLVKFRQLFSSWF